MSPLSIRSAGVLALVIATGAIVAAMPVRLRETRVRSQPTRRVVAIVIDDIGMTADDVDGALARFANVRSALRVSDLVAVASTGFSSIAADVQGVPAMTRRLDQAADKIRVSHRAPARQSPRVLSPLYPTYVSLSTVNDVLARIVRDVDDPKVLVVVTGPSDFDPFAAIRRLRMAGHALPPVATGWQTPVDDLSANILVAQLESVLQTAEQHGVDFLTLEGNGYFSWKADGSNTRVAGIVH